MFNVGDIVKLKPSFIGDYFLFRIWHINRDSTGFYYNLRRVEQELDLTRGSSKWQLDLIDRIEHQDWRDCELEPVENNLTSYIRTSPETISISSTGIKMYNTTSADYESPVLTNMYNKITQNINDFINKELKEDNMKILDIYGERKELERDTKLKEEKEKIIAEDEIQKIILEMQLQINTILENDGSEERVDLASPNKNILTIKSQEKIFELEKAHKNERIEASKTLEELKALFELTEDYQERMKILKKYGIIDKDGKVNI